MNSLAIILMILGCWFTYVTSKKTEKVALNLSISRWLHQNHKLSNYLGLLFVLSSTVVLMFTIGWVSGFFLGTVLYAVIAVAVLLVAPFNAVNWKHISAMSILFIVLEFTFQNV